MSVSEKIHEIINQPQLFQAIQGFRETERKHFNTNNTATVNRIKDISFPREGHESRILPYTHVLDLADFGFIKPHIDSSRVSLTI